MQLIPANRLFSAPCEVFLHKTHLQTHPPRTHAQTQASVGFLTWQRFPKRLGNAKSSNYAAESVTASHLLFSSKFLLSDKDASQAGRMEKQPQDGPRNGTGPFAADGAGEGSGTGSPARTDGQSCTVPTPPVDYRDITVPLWNACVRPWGCPWVSLVEKPLSHTGAPAGVSRGQLWPGCWGRCPGSALAIACFFGSCLRGCLSSRLFCQLWKPPKHNTRVMYLCHKQSKIA